MISGLSDNDIRKEVLGWSDLDVKTVKDTVTFIESKEMARDALNKQIQHASIAQNNKTGKRRCKNCSTEIDKFTLRLINLHIINVNEK